MADLNSVLFHSPRNGGGGHYVKQLELMRYLAGNDVSVTFVSPSGFESNAKIAHVSDRQLDLTGTSYMTHLLSVLKELLVRGPDRFVPFTLFGGFVGAIAGLLRPGTETVLFIRGDLFTGRALAGELRYVLLKRLTVGVEWITFRLVDRIIFISEQNREMMLERARLTTADVDSYVLYNDVYTDRVREQLGEEPKDPDGWPVLGYAGEFPTDGGKGLRYLLAAVDELSETYPDVQLYLLGDGGNLASLRRLAADLGVDDRVHFTGWVDQPIPYMRSFDLFVLPSLHEGLGNSLLESLAADTPVAGSDVGGIPEVVGDERYLFDPRSTSAIVETVDRIFESDESYRAAVEHCRERRRTFDFDWATAAARLLETGSEASADRIPPDTGSLRASRARAAPAE